MTRETLLQALADAGGRPSEKNPSSFTFEERAEVTLLLGSGAELLSVERVRTVELKPSYVVVQAAREAIVVLPERIFAIKFVGSPAHGAGFVG